MTGLMVPSTEAAPFEIRCPLPHPTMDGSPCDRLLARYGRPTSGVVSVKCPRCKCTVTLHIQAT